MKKKQIMVRTKRIFSFFFNLIFFIEIELYYEYKQNQGNIKSANTRIGSCQDRTEFQSRISSSKTYVTEVTEKSSLWETSSVISRAATSFVFLFNFNFIFIHHNF